MAEGENPVMSLGEGVGDEGEHHVGRPRLGDAGWCTDVPPGV